MNLIELHNIHKTYYIGELDIPVLKGISLTVEKGELVALMGASGSGKSTLMNILGCLDHPTSGEYWLEGREISKLSPNERAFVRNRQMGFVFQNFNLLPRTSALENIIMPLFYSGKHLSEKEMHLRGMELLERFGLESRSHHDPSQLSGGQQQRVAIARSLVNNPPLIFADEPTGNLDSKTSEDVLETFKRLNETDGITIILVTHSDEVAQHARRVIHIHDGLIMDGIYRHAAAPQGV